MTQTVNEADFDFDESDVALSDQTDESNGPAVEETVEPSADAENATGTETSNDSAETIKVNEAQTGDYDDGATESSSGDIKLDKDSLSEYLAKRHIDPNDPEALLKVAEMHRNAEKKLNESSQAKAKLERQIADGNIRQASPDQQALAEVRSLKAQISVSDWKRQKGLTPADEQKMIAYLSEPLLDDNGKQVIVPGTGQALTRATLITQNLLSLDEVYKIVGGGVTENTKVDSLKASLKDEVRKEMAAKQGLKRPAATATNSAQFGKSEENDPFAEEFDKD